MPELSPQLRPVLRRVYEHENLPAPKRRDSVRNRAAIIEAARELFAAKGFDTGMDEIAHHAGLGIGTVYRHFANKYDLANAIFDDAVAAFVDAAEEAITVPDPWQSLVTVIECALEMQTGNRALREMLLSGDHFQDDRHHLIVREVGIAFDIAKTAGVLRPDVERCDVAMILTMLCVLADTPQSSPDQWRRYLPVLLEALRNSAISLSVPTNTQQSGCRLEARRE